MRDPVARPPAREGALALVYVLPIAASPTDAMRDCVETIVRRFFGWSTAWLPQEPLPAGAYDEKRGQADSTPLMHLALERIPPDARRLLAVTEVDIMTPMLSFLFGRAQLEGPVALVSMARLGQEAYGREADHALLCERFRKEVLHELCHTFGLRHCDDRGCALSHSVSIFDIDRKQLGLCASCEERLRASARKTQGGIER
jgi:archaemetzincin